MAGQRELAERREEPGPPGLGRDFRVYAAGQAVSVAGDRIALIALVFLVIRLSHSYAPALALFYVCRVLPTFAGGLVVGVLVDHFNRRSLLIGCDLGRAALLAVVPALTSIQVGLLYPIVMVLYALTLAFGTSARAALPDLVPEGRMMQANAILQGIQTTGDLAYAAGGAMVFALQLATPFYIDAATFLFSALMISGMQVPGREPRPLPRIGAIFAQIRSGMSHLNSQPFLKWSAPAFSLGPFAGGVALVLSPLYAAHVLAHSPALLGPLRSGAFRFSALEVSIGVGALLGSIAAPRLAQHRPRGQIFGWGLISMGAVTTLLAFTSNLYVAAAIMAASGFGNSLFLISGITLLQTLAPSDIRGRVIATRQALVNGSLALGSAVAAGLLLLFPYSVVWIVLGAIIATGSLFVWLSPEARRQP